MKIVFATLILFLGPPALLIAKTVAVAPMDIFLDIPDDWIMSSDPGKQIANAVLFVANSSHDSVVICAYPSLEGSKIDSTFINDLKIGITKAPETSIIGEEQPVNLSIGATYRIAIKTNRPGKKTIFAYCYPLAVSGKLYVMTVQSFEQEELLKLESIALGMHSTTSSSQ